MPRSWIEWLILTVVVCGAAWTFSVEWLDRRAERQRRGFEVDSKKGVDE